MKLTRKIIGFRSGNRKNKVIALIGYILFVFGLIPQILTAPTAWDSFVHTLAWILLFLFVLIPIADIFLVRRKFFFFNRKSFIGKVMGIFGYVVLALIVCSVVGVGMESATAKQLEAKQQAEQAAKNKAEADAKVKAEAQAKVKAEAQAKAKAEARAKAKAEADAKAKAEADAKAKAEADAKAKAEADAKAKAEADAKAKAEADAKAEAATQTPPAQSTTESATAPQPSQPKQEEPKAQVAAVQQQPAPAPPKQEEPKQQATVQILSVSDPAPRNSTATLRAKVKPGATASIAVHYESGDSHAQGLESKQADANGNVSWSWHVGGRTTLGSVPITVTCNGASAETQFTVVH
ncbi:hypothetical protein [Ectobacillus panaciterrae]|uniref:hypothetical protein n=1 Tax=Ectobacillus panaciterrae TaxID=363872 RepID=UPI000403B5FC|nr:hypothetical protein [Ectobacillus panaciterrae]